MDVSFQILFPLTSRISSQKHHWRLNWFLISFVTSRFVWLAACSSLHPRQSFIIVVVFVINALTTAASIEDQSHKQKLRETQQLGLKAEMCRFEAKIRLPSSRPDTTHALTKRVVGLDGQARSRDLSQHYIRNTFVHKTMMSGFLVLLDQEVSRRITTWPLGQHANVRSQTEREKKHSETFF